MEAGKTLPSNAQERKEIPVGTGVLDYFPDALAAVAHVSFIGNQQHNPGQPLHWAREKSTDHADCIIRHFMERGTVDVDGTRHSAKLCWRALALLQLEIEADVARQTANASRNSGSLIHGETRPEQPPKHSKVPGRENGLVQSASAPEDDATGHF